jgi:hypothetical protein
MQLLKTGKTSQNRLHYRLVVVQESRQVEWQSRQVEWQSRQVEWQSRQVEWQSRQVEWQSLQVEWQSWQVEWQSWQVEWQNRQVEWQNEYQVQDWTLERVLHRHLESLRNPSKLERKGEFTSVITPSQSFFVTDCTEPGPLLARFWPGSNADGCRNKVPSPAQ